MHRTFAFAAVTLFVAAPAAAQKFELASADVRDNTPLSLRQVFNDFGCKGKNESPQLKWTGAPAETKSFAVTAYDPDAPTGSGWWHWIVYNLPSTVTQLPGNASASGHVKSAGGIEGRTDYGKPGFGGACPPPGDKPHHYVFTVYALKTDKLPVDQDASPAMVGYFIHQNKLASATITATYARPAAPAKPGAAAKPTAKPAK